MHQIHTRLNPRRGCQHSSSINVDAAAATELVGDLVVITAAEFNSGGGLRRPNPMMCWGGRLLADTSCTVPICFTMAPFDQSLVTTCWKGGGEEIRPAIASVLMDVGLEEFFWIRLAYR